VEKAFAITDFFDSARWIHDSDLINFSNQSFDADEKILTHWLCYIVDRQMPFLTYLHLDSLKGLKVIVFL